MPNLAPESAVETPPCATISENEGRRACERCGGEFRPYRRWARFCSPRCRFGAYLDRRAAQIAGAGNVERVIVYRQPKRRKRPQKPAVGPGNPKLVAAMVRGLLAASERATIHTNRKTDETALIQRGWCHREGGWTMEVKSEAR